MDLRETIAFINSFEKELRLFNFDPSDPTVSDLETFFDTQNIRITTHRTTSGAPTDVAVLSNGDKVLEMTSRETLRELVGHSQPRGGRVGVADAEFDRLLDPIKETTFTSYSTQQMFYASREIEDRAHRTGEGTIHTGFQRCSAMADQQGTYRDLARRGVTVHAYGVPDVAPPDLVDGHVHQIQTAEIADFWFVVFDGGDQQTQKCALIAEQRGEDAFYGAWTYDAAIVDTVCDYLQGAYLSADDQSPRTGR
jgi:DICT domain-containing protein